MSVSKERVKERVIRIIAASRFPFVDQKDWPDDYITITNEQEKRRGIDSPTGKVYPSIIIVDDADRVRELGEVEDEDTVTEVQVLKWKLLSEKTGMGRRTKKFFLYVPGGKGKDGRKTP